MKRSVLLLFVLILTLCTAVSADEPGLSIGVTELQQGEAILFGIADFSDVPESHWAYESVRKAAQFGLTAGRGDGSFAPDADMTRAEFVTMLHRMEGSPKAGASASFADVAADSWYAPAVDWAAENGLVNGVDETHFGTEQTITRQELVTVLYRLSGGVSGAEVMFTSVYDEHFADSDAIAPWAKAAMYWGVYKGLISGTAADALSPEGTATRAQVAAILVRYTEKVQ